MLRGLERAEGLNWWSKEERATVLWVEEIWLELRSLWVFLAFHKRVLAHLVQCLPNQEGITRLGFRMLPRMRQCNITWMKPVVIAMQPATRNTRPYPLTTSQMMQQCGICLDSHRILSLSIQTLSSTHSSLLRSHKQSQPTTSLVSYLLSSISISFMDTHTILFEIFGSTSLDCLFLCHLIRTHQTHNQVFSYW